MRLFPILSFWFLSAFVLPASTVRADGVRFFHGSWSQVMAEARRQNKPIFVDVYTTWCGPCKLMNAQLFPNARVGGRMNEQFISYKIDAEKGEGETIAKRYGVQAFPTSLFISVEGRLIRRTIGYNGVDSFLAEAQRALSDANASHAMAVWNKKYDAGDRSPEFLRGMLRKQAEYDRPTGDVLDDYVKILPKADTLAASEMKFLGEMLATTYTKAYLLLAQQARLIAQNPARKAQADEVAKAFARAERYDFTDAVANQDEIMLESLIKNKAARQRAQLGVNTATPDLKAKLEREADDTRLQFYKASRLPVHYVSMLRKIGETRLMTKTDTELTRADSLATTQPKPLLDTTLAYLPDSTSQLASVAAAAAPEAPRNRPVTQLTARQLCDLAKTLTEQSADKKDLAMALRWTERAVQLDSTPANVITYSRLLNRSGRKADAKLQLSKAIAREQASTETASALRQELARLK